MTIWAGTAAVNSQQATIDDVKASIDDMKKQMATKDDLNDALLPLASSWQPVLDLQSVHFLGMSHAAASGTRIDVMLVCDPPVSQFAENASSRRRSPKGTCTHGPRHWCGRRTSTLALRPSSWSCMGR